MSHYKSNIRDIEFNLFEVLGRDEVLGSGPFAEVDADTARSILARGGPAGPRGPRRVVRGRRPQPAGLRPDDQHRADARVVQEELPRPGWTPSTGASSSPAELGGTPAPSSLELGDRRAGARRQPRRSGCTPPARCSPASCYRNGNERDKKIAQHMVDKQLGRHHGAHRARRRLRRRRRPHQGHPATRTAPGTSRASSGSSPPAEHDLSENIIHLVLARPVGRRGRRRPGHQGPLAVHRAEVPLRPRDR